MSSTLEPRRWCFPVAGCVPYLGYFDQTAAEQKAAKLARQGYDTTVSPASAYSTLGWFDDPLLDTLLLQSGAGRGRHADPRAGASDSCMFRATPPLMNPLPASSKSKACGAGCCNAMNRRNGNSGKGPWPRARSSCSCCSETRSQLEDVYAADLTLTQQREAKQQVFDTLAERHQRLVEHHWQGHAYYGDWINPRPNNADLALDGAIPRWPVRVYPAVRTVRRRAWPVSTRPPLSRRGCRPSSAMPGWLQPC